MKTIARWRNIFRAYLMMGMKKREIVYPNYQSYYDCVVMRFFHVDPYGRGAGYYHYIVQTRRRGRYEIIYCGDRSYDDMVAHYWYVVRDLFCPKADVYDIINMGEC